MSDKLRTFLWDTPYRSITSEWKRIEAEFKKNGELTQGMRLLIKSDLYYLLVRVCNRPDMLHPWVYERCREVEKSPNGFLDLWSREHYKSTIITYGLTMQTILNDPDSTIGLFSHTRPIAKAFLRQIMREFEDNQTLHLCFPDILWGKDVRQSPKWSEDDGIIVKRKTNPNEATIEAWGLVDGQPTSKHFRILLYDDIVVKGSVTNEDMIEKTMTSLEESYNLGTTGGTRRFAGTRWHFNDAYSTIIKRGTVKVRLHPGKEGGSEDGKSVLWPEELHKEKRRDMGPYTYAAQILLNPKADAMQGFQREWIRKYESVNPRNMNKYICVDAASSKKRGSDYTCMVVIGLGHDENYYLLDMIRDRLNLTERAARLFELHRKWKPRQVRYERYGMMADIEHIKDKQEKDSYRFDITEVGGQSSKQDRIGRLVPIFEDGRFYLPRSLSYTDYQKVRRDLVNDFIEEEFLAFPVGLHDDMLDAISRIAEPDLSLAWPKESGRPVRKEKYFSGNGDANWLAA